MQAFAYWFLVLALGAGVMGCGESSGVASTCGNDIIEGSEECDDGNTIDSDGCDSMCKLESTCGDGVREGLEECDEGEEGSATCNAPDVAEPCQFTTTIFRLTSLRLVDPGNNTINFANTPIGEAIDDFSLNIVLSVSPLDQTAGSDRTVNFAQGDCTSPAEGQEEGFVPSCSVDADAVVASLDMSVSDDEDCFVPVNTDIYQAGASCRVPEPEEPLIQMCPLGSIAADDMCPPAGPDTDADFGSLGPGDDNCFTTAPGNVILSLGSIQIPLEGADISAQFDGDPANGLVNGVLRGFLSSEVADGTRTPGNIDVLGGQPISFLYQADVLDVGPDDEAAGFWIHALFEAQKVTWRGGSTCGDGVLGAGEACDPGIAAGLEGDCRPLTDCADDNDCTADSVTDGDPCNPSCQNSLSESDLQGSDGCCGLNGVVEGWKDSILDDPDCADDFFEDLSYCTEAPE